jgi:hypothetical protein
VSLPLTLFASLPSFHLLVSSAPIGIRCSPFPPPVNPNPDTNPYLAQTDILTGFGLGKTILSEDLNLNTFPFTSFNFPEFVTDRELKRFSVLQLKLHEVIHEKDILRLEANKGIPDPITTLEGVTQVKEAVGDISSNILQWIQSQEFMTLWEMWKYITVTLKAQFRIELLRQIIASDVTSSSGPFADLELYYLHLPSEDELYASSDGLRVKQVVHQRFNTEGYYESYSLCSCHTLRGGVMAGDGVGDADLEEDYDSFDLYAQLSSYGFSQTRSQGESFPSASASTQPLLKCCGLETCLVPHLIVYKLKNQIWPEGGEGSSANQTKRRQTRSDVTFDVVSSLKGLWDEEEG